MAITLFCCLVFGTGEPGALEAHIRQLDKALDTSRFQIQQTENIIRSKTPTGPELDATYKGYVRVLAFHYMLTLLKKFLFLVTVQYIEAQIR